MRNPLKQDPYAYSCTANMHSSVVIDLDKVRRVDYPLTELKHNTDAVIYEVGVRDFSVDEFGQITHKGKFLGFCEEGTVTKNGFSSYGLFRYAWCDSCTVITC